MSQTPNASRPGSKKTSVSRGTAAGGAHARLAIDPRLVLARVYHLQRLRRERALLLAPAAHRYSPRMDLYDDETSPSVAAMLELPGVDRRNLTLRVQGTKLIVHGERGAPLATHVQQNNSALRDTRFAAQSYKVRELKFGSFHREIDIPAGIETSDVAAELTDGMLLISWPRNPAGNGSSRAQTHAS